MPWVMLALLALGEFLGMTLWFSATAVTPALVAELHLTAGQASWLTMAVQGGFVAGTLASALLNLPDILNARRLFALGCLIGAAANAALVRVATPTDAIALRVITGAALAWVYPTGMKVAAGWFVRRRGTALGILIGALTLGKAFPHLLASFAIGGWRAEIVVASWLAAAGGIIVLLAVRDGPHVSATSRFDRHAAWQVFADRGTRLATLGYLGHMWELYAMWTWVGVFAAASVAGRPNAAHTGSIAAFVGIGAGAIGCVVAGLGADRVGKARVAAWAMMGSATCAALSSAIFGLGPSVLYALVAAWGFTVVADSAQFSALVADYSRRDHVGTALTVQTCAGFLLTMGSIWLLGVLAEAFGWRWVFLAVVPGPVLGVVAMRRLQATQG
jgi:MFS family permease